MASAFFVPRAHGTRTAAVQLRRPPEEAGRCAAPPHAVCAPPQPSPFPAHHMFPAARSHLWDRAASGPVTVIDLRNMALYVQLAPDAWPILQRLAAAGWLQHGAARAAPLVATLMPGSSNISRGGLIVQLGIGSGPPGAATVPVALGAAASHAASAAADVAQELEVAASRAPAPAGLANLLAMRLACQPDGRGGLLLAGAAATPAPILDFKPLLALRVAPSPLAHRLNELLAHPAAAAPPVEDGLLSMDRGRSLVPLPASDPGAYSVPLVGCWVAGVQDIRHPLVAAAALRFLCSKALGDKALAVDASFLLLLYPSAGAATPLCYEVHIALERSSVPLLLRSFALAWHPEQGPPDAAACEATPCVSAPLPSLPPALSSAWQGAGLRPCSSAASWRSGTGQTARASAAQLNQQCGMSLPLPPPSYQLLVASAPASVCSWPPLPPPSGCLPESPPRSAAAAQRQSCSPRAPAAAWQLPQPAAAAAARPAAAGDAHWQAPTSLPCSPGTQGDGGEGPIACGTAARAAAGSSPAALQAEQSLDAAASLPSLSAWDSRDSFVFVPPHAPHAPAAMPPPLQTHVRAASPLPDQLKQPVAGLPFLPQPTSTAASDVAALQQEVQRLRLDVAQLLAFVQALPHVAAAPPLLLSLPQQCQPAEQQQLLQPDSQAAAPPTDMQPTGDSSSDAGPSSLDTGEQEQLGEAGEAGGHAERQRWREAEAAIDQLIEQAERAASAASLLPDPAAASFGCAADSPVPLDAGGPSSPAAAGPIMHVVALPAVQRSRSYSVSSVEDEEEERDRELCIKYGLLPPVGTWRAGSPRRRGGSSRRWDLLGVE